MRMAATVLSLLGLGLTVVPAFFVFNEALSWRVHTQLMFAGMILWFVFAPMWFKKRTV